MGETRQERRKRLWREAEAYEAGRVAALDKIEEAKRLLNEARSFFAWTTEAERIDAALLALDPPDL